MTKRVRLRSHFVPNSSRNDVDTRSVPVGNGVDGNEVNRNGNAVPERSRGNEVVVCGTVVHGSARSVQQSSKPVNVRGGSRDPNRGTWCTPAALAKTIGGWDLDPFSNPRSHIVSKLSCQLERGDDGLVPIAPGSFYRFGHGTARADASTRVFVQPPYSIVLPALRHYAHTRFCALLRFDPRTEWFDVVYDASELVCVLRTIEFEPPPGMGKGGGNSFPHALYYRRAEDATPEVLAMTIAWRKKAR